jgi:hypothetical protein
VRLGRPTEVQNAASREGDEVARASEGFHILAEGRVRIVRRVRLCPFDLTCHAGPETPSIFRMPRSGRFRQSPSVVRPSCSPGHRAHSYAERHQSIGTFFSSCLAAIFRRSVSRRRSLLAGRALCRGDDPRASRSLLWSCLSLPPAVTVRPNRNRRAHAGTPIRQPSPLRIPLCARSCVSSRSTPRAASSQGDDGDGRRVRREARGAAALARQTGSSADGP